MRVASQRGNFQRNSNKLRGAAKAASNTATINGTTKKLTCARRNKIIAPAPTMSSNRHDHSVASCKLVGTTADLASFAADFRGVNMPSV
jgi:hypothetical protein